MAEEPRFALKYGGRPLPRLTLTVYVYDDSPYVRVEARGVNADMGVSIQSTIEHMVRHVDRCARLEDGV